MPCVAIAGGNGLNTCSAVIDSQVQGDSTVATERIESGELRIESGGGVGAVMPCVAVASDNGFNARSAVIDSQVQGDGTIATH